MSEMLKLGWKDHPRAIVTSFRSLLDKGELVDVTLSTEDGFLKCHKLVLASSSIYFEKLFQQNLCSQQGSNLVIFLKDVSFWELENLIHFIYNGDVSVPKSKLSSLIRAAKSLKIRGLKGLENPEQLIGLKGSSENSGRGGTPRRSPSVSSTTPPLVNQPCGTSILKKVVAMPQLRAASASTANLKRVQAPQGQPSASMPKMPRLSQDPLRQEGQRQRQKQDQRKSEATLPESEEQEQQEDDEGPGSYQESGEDEQDQEFQNVSPNMENGASDIGEPSTYRLANQEDRNAKLEKASALAMTGMTVRQAASMFDIPRTTLCAYMKRKGLSKPGGRTNATIIRSENLNNQSGGSNGFPFLGLSEMLEEEGLIEGQ